MRVYMKSYTCKMCSDYYPHGCTVCVPDTTPDNFDKTILNRHCHRGGKIPKWWKTSDYMLEHNIIVFGEMNDI